MPRLIGCIAVFHAYDAATLVAMVPLYTVSVLGGRRRSLLVGLGTAAVLAATIAVLEAAGNLSEGESRLALVLGAVVVGDLIRSRRALRGANRERAQREARDREQRSRKRRSEERLQIARELHDTL